MSKATVKFVVEFEVDIKEENTADGVWYYANSPYGQCNSNTKHDCVRILTERAKNRAGI